jgi:hypothetical protein
MVNGIINQVISRAAAGSQGCGMPGPVCLEGSLQVSSMGPGVVVLTTTFKDRGPDGGNDTP